MRRCWIVLVPLLLCGCQTVALRSGGGGVGDALARLEAALPGAYDNHQQVKQAAVSVKAGTTVAAPHLREDWRLLERNHSDSLWLWQLQTPDQGDTAAATWLYRVTTTESGNKVRLMPYRAIDLAATKTALDGKKFKFIAAQWAQLTTCALNGAWKDSRFDAMADVAACSALLPGLGAAAALLPLRFSLDGDMLHSVTFADQARGTGASIDARRMRWFDGWAAINGGGPKAKSGNQDWHVQKDLRLSSEGGHVKLHWRDGAASGYSLELARTSYPERKLDVLQLNVIDDATGQVIDYVWANPAATAIGFNLGWLQVGLTQASPARE